MAGLPDPSPPSRRGGLRTSTLLWLVIAIAIPLGVIVDGYHRKAREGALAQPLIDAATRGDPDAVRALLDQGANINSVVNGRFPWTPLMHASFEGHLETARLLLDRGAAVNREDLDGFTAATLAAEGEHWEVLKLLAARGEDIRRADATGRSALDRARSSGRRKLVEELLAPDPE